MSDELIIAIAQSYIAHDIGQNGQHIRDMMLEASSAGARLIQFPEGALSGYIKSQIASWAAVDWKVLEFELQDVLSHAKELGLWVALGSCHDLQLPNRPFNSMYIISDSGEIRTRYDKRLCSNAEINDWYSSGSDPQVFEIDGFRFGCALCIEIQFPEVFAEYERMDVDCVLFSAYSSDPLFWTQAQGHAASNNIWISVSTPSQCGDRLQGGLIGPHGYCLSRGSATTTPHIQLAEINSTDEALQISLTHARPWRRRARQGKIYDPKIRRESL